MRDLLRGLLGDAHGDPSAAVTATLGALIAAAPVGIAVLDAELRVVAVNGSLVATAGGDVQLNYPVADALPGAAELAVIAGEVRDTGRASLGVAWRGALCHCQPIRVANRIVGVMWTVGEDVAGQARAAHDEALARERATRAALDAAVLFEDRLFAAMSHELRAPLATIQLWDRALRERPDDAALRDQGLAAIRNSAAVQAQLIDTLLELGQARRGALRIELRSFDVQTEIAAAVERIGGLAAARSLAIELHGQSRLGVISADPERIRQILDQLLSNAVKFTAPGGRIIVTARRAGEVVEIAVADTGAGFAPDALADLFEPFVGSGAPRRGAGLGVGLALARAIVEAHGGTLGARSDGEGRGATFVVKLPGAPRARTLPPPLGAAPDLDLHGVRVLLVDDDRDTLHGLASLLRTTGLAVTTADSAAAAWVLLEREPFDVLVSDIAMSDGGDGYALVRRVRAHPAMRGLHAVALTGHAQPSDRDRAFAAGFDAHVAKPIDFDQLAAVLARRRAAVL